MFLILYYYLMKNASIYQVELISNKALFKSFSINWISYMKS